MPEFYTGVILLINQSLEIGEKQLSDFGYRGGQISPLMHIPLSIFSSFGHFVQWSRSISAILVESLIINICAICTIYFELGQVVQKEKFKHFEFIRTVISEFRI